LKDNKQKRAKKPPFYNFCYDFVKITGAIPVMLWLRPKIYRPYGTKTPRGGVMVSANHRSLLDPIIIHTAFASRRMDSLATKELFNTPLKSKFFNQMHCIMVDKQNFTLSAFHQVINRLNDGKMVVIFPEGGLNTDENQAISPFKSGAVLMAHKAAAPIIPVYIVPRKKWHHRQRIVIGELFNVREEVGDAPTLVQLNEASEALRQKELALREYFESLPVYKKLNKKSKTSEGEKSHEQKV
jgi:1-acyl-sn-glycerol-3-phosphate acyltransferase